MFVRSERLRLKSSRHWLLLAASTAAMLMGNSSLALADEVALAEAADPVEEVIVTARFRNERLQDVPIAIGTLTGRQLDAAHNDTLRQIQQQAPSLQILGFNPRNVSITIRGLGTNSGSTNDGLEQGVGIYIDGVYHARPSVAVSDLVDVSRIDVLRGPQGTLFGKNTTAGAINITSNAPTFTPEASGELTLGNYGFRQAKLVASGPLSETVAGRLTLYGTHRDGTLYNHYHNEDWDDYNNYGFRAQLLYQPSDALSVRFIADYNKQFAQGGIYVAKDVLPTTLNDGSTKRGYYQRAQELGYTPLPIDPFAREVDIDTSQKYNFEIGGVSASVDYLLPNNFKLTSISGYREFIWDPSLDADFIGLPILLQGNIPTHQKQFTQEVRLSSPEDRAVVYTVGGYYFWQKARSDYYLTYGPQGSAWVVAATAPAAILENLTSYANYTPITKSYSVFGQATWNIDEKLSLTGGLRYTYEDKYGTYTGYATGDYTPVSELPEAWRATATTLRNSIAPTLSYDAAVDGGNWSGTVNLAYKPRANILTYASYSRGFKSSGINFANSISDEQRIVKPETVDSYELGAKTQFFDRRLTLNGVLFSSDIANYQGTNVDASKGLSYISNAGKVRSQGVELDARAILGNGLTATLSTTYTDATYVSFPASTCPYLDSYKASCDLSGQRLAGVSRWAASAALDYVTSAGALAANGLEAYGGVNYSYRSWYYSAINNDPYSRVPGYALVGGQAGIRSDRGNWDLSVWVRNAFDKEYYNVISVYTTTLLANASLGEPRYWGVTLKVRK
ncbi:MAG: TonB-dependent receptor [Asticcacaulis sp.]